MKWTMVGLVLVVGCGGSAAPGASGAATDTTVGETADTAVVDAATAGSDGKGTSALPPAPKGDGFCCPPGQPGCDCPRRGGWIAKDEPLQCAQMPSAPCDLQASAFSTSSDEHGCPILVAHGYYPSCLKRPKDAE